jgi:hypothetical protein
MLMSPESLVPNRSWYPFPSQEMATDGIPLTDNRSPSFGPEIEADDLDSVSVYTAGIPAEYGRKMGGIVELNTRRQATDGLHGQNGSLRWQL